MWRRLAALGLALSLAVASPVPAAAHAILVESSPPAGATLAPGEISLRLRFNSRIDGTRSRITLIRADKTTEVLPIESSGSDDVLLARVALAAGSYVVRWQVLAVDGHITRGDVAFAVRAED